MQKKYTIGFPRIGEQRELKRALESYWAKKSEFCEVEKVANELKKRHWEYQKDANIDFISSNDFSFYDNMLDTSIMLGAIPKRFRELDGLERYFAMARGSKEAVAMEMTKWFNTNYHYIVPELCADDEYRLNCTKIINEYNEAKDNGIKTKINIIGPITYLGLSKRVDRGESYELHGKILPIYEELLSEISKLDDEVVVQIDEPIFVKDLEPKVLSLIKPTYDRLANVAKNIKISVVTYFEHSNEATQILVHTPIWAIGLDFVYGKENLNSLELIVKSDKKLICGVIDGRNIWKNDMNSTLKLLEKISNVVDRENMIISTSCSLLHVPYSLKYETSMDNEIKNWLSFGIEKLQELKVVTNIFFDEASKEDKEAFEDNIKSNESRKSSSKIHNISVQNRVKSLTKFERDDKFEDRIKIQREILAYSSLPTTTIGSFPQTEQLRELRADFKKNVISNDNYKEGIKDYIKECVAFQEECGIDVFVHDEPERNDMVEYFGEQMNGYGFSQNGWVQSYGSRCVKPPFIYGDISRPKPITLEWITYAQSLTSHIMKGMLTGPVTILNWSFVRDDMPRSEVSKQIAVALSDEIDDLQKTVSKSYKLTKRHSKRGIL